MPSLSRCRQARCLVFVAQVVGLFVAFYFYVLLRIRPELFYQQKPDVFLFDGYFCAIHLDKPGGPVEYASAFLSPLFAFGWLGAAVVTVLTALICLAFRLVLADKGGHAVFLIPAVLILMVMGRYNHPVRLCVGLAVVLALGGAYVRTGRGTPAVRLAAFVIVSGLAYYAAAGLYGVFAVLCGVVEWRVRGCRSAAVCCVLSAVAVPLVAGVWLCELNVQEAYRGMFLPAERYWLAIPSSALLSKSLRAALLLFFPVAALTVGWRRRRACLPAVALETQTPHDDRPEDAAEATWRPASGLRLTVLSAALLVSVAVADALLFDVSTKNLLLVASSAEREQWADVLTYARRLPPADAWNVFQVNRALYHRGELLERMFAYPQVADSVATLTLQSQNLTATAQQVPLEFGDMLFDLGRINESQHMAYEAFELFGARPGTLKRLVDLHAIKGEPDAARRFLAVLERSLLHRSWARDRLLLLDADPTLAGVVAVASRRALMVERDFSGKLTLEPMLAQLLERNPRNRMAFEYLMAYYLLTRQVDKLVANLRRFDDFGQTRLPRHCEEAILIHLDAAGPSGHDLGGRRIGPETRQRSVEFVQAAERFQGNATAAFAALHGGFGDSYFFFYVFGHNDPRLAAARPSR
ncbi:MAG: hypothetical protein GX575_27230 [Candidatus Anammoximicrobium sp.]|nr:hypothetical protein [Candidatus Anammoximicrobium sp.]